MIDVRLLGPVEVRAYDGSKISIGRERIRAVLAMLALGAPEMVTADEIIDALWGDSEKSKPESALQMSISRLRAALGDDRIETVAGGYRLNIESPAMDVGRFRALVRRGRQMSALEQHVAAVEAFRQALGEWRGPALSDVRRFEFAERGSQRFEEERLAASEGLVDALIGSKEYGEAISELTGLVEVHPYLEQFWSLLMIALYRSGRHADALAAFGRVRRIFGEDLGLAPSPALGELEDRILLHDPSLSISEPSAEGSDIAEVITFAPGATIVTEGEPASTVYWIERGAVEIVKIDERGGVQRVAELGPGQYFGELAATLGVRRTATARALERTVATVLDLDGFRARVGSPEADRASRREV